MRATIKINKIISLLLIAAMSVIMMFCGGMTANAANLEYATGKIDASKGAVVRSGTGTSSKNKALLKNNTKIKISKEIFIKKTSIKKVNRWYKIITPSGQSGFIRSDLIKSIKYKGTKATVNAALNYRKGAGSKMEKAGTLNEGDSIKVLLPAKAAGSDKTWYKFRKNGKYYYVSGDYLTIEGAEDPADTENPENPDTVSNENLSIDATDDTDEGTSVESGGVKFKLSDIRYPESIAKGSPFSIMGNIRSSAKLSRIDAVVTNKSGKWIISSGKKLDGYTADLGELDYNLKFGTLSVGKYKYKAIVKTGGKSVTVFSYDFKVKEAKKAKAITKKAFELAWPEGTSSGKYNYPNGKARSAYTKALDEVYPGRKWGKAPQVGASCDVFVGTVLRASGAAPDCPRGLDEQIPYFKKSGLFTKVSYNGDRSVLRSGDVVIYNHGSGTHVCIYVTKNGKAYIAEANYQATFGRLESSEKGLNWRLNKSGKKWLRVYRAVE